MTIVDLPRSMFVDGKRFEIFVVRGSEIVARCAAEDSRRKATICRETGLVTTTDAAFPAALLARIQERITSGLGLVA